MVDKTGVPAPREDVAIRGDRKPPPASSSMLSPKTWQEFFTKVPCVKESFVTGLVMGGVMMFHVRRTYPKDLRRAVNFAFGSFVFGSSASFLLCAESYNTKYKNMTDAKKKSGIPVGKKGSV